MSTLAASLTSAVWLKVMMVLVSVVVPAKRHGGSSARSSRANRLDFLDNQSINPEKAISKLPKSLFLKSMHWNPACLASRCNRAYRFTKDGLYMYIEHFTYLDGNTAVWQIGGGMERRKGGNIEPVSFERLMGYDDWEPVNPRPLLAKDSQAP